MNQLSEVMRSPRGWLLPALVMGSCLAVGAAIAASPAIGVGVGLAMCGATLALALPGIGSRTFLGALTFLLLGYAFAGRGFAYIGAAPVYIGEVVLALGLLALLLDSRRAVSFRSPLVWVLVAFMIWGAACTIPYFPIYGMLSLRDAVVWGYAILVFSLVPILVRDRTIERIPALYGRILPIYVLWVPFAVIVDQLIHDVIPFVPGTEVPIIDVKPGDLNVHLAGAAAFMLLGVNEHAKQRANGSAVTLGRALLWAIWLAGFAMAGVLNRGGMLSVFVALAIVMAVRPLAVGRRLIMMGAVGFFIVGSLMLSNIEIRLSDRRPLSVEQITQNIVSIFSEEENQDGTREWRLLWWAQIVDYTVFGPHFLTGKGYGINLANSDGFQVHSDESLRSPHNGHLTVLARSGVPGMALWLMLQLGFAAMMIRTYRRSREAGDERIAAMAVWLLAYWSAFMVNGAFDVFLEGPQGGIWLWAIFGMGVAATLVSREKERERRAELEWALPASAPMVPRRHTTVPRTV